MSTNRKVKGKAGKTTPHAHLNKSHPPSTLRPFFGPRFPLWPVDKTGATKTIIKPTANAPLLLSLRQNKRQGGIFPAKRVGFQFGFSLGLG